MASSVRRNVLAAAAFLAAGLAVPALAAEVAKPAPKPGAIALAAPADLGAAIAAVEKATGAKADKLPFGDGSAAEGRSFEVETTLADRLLAGSHETFKRAGFYLFRYERSYGLAGDKDRLAVVGTADHRAVIRKVGTGRAHQGLTGEKVIAWLDALAKDEPFDLWEVGTDYVAGRFERAPKDPAAIARRCAEFAPELVAGRASTLDLLAHEIAANRTLYLIW
jgi:hypothetical protein